MGIEGHRVGGPRRVRPDLRATRSSPPARTFIGHLAWDATTESRCTCTLGRYFAGSRLRAPVASGRTHRPGRGRRSITHVHLTGCRSTTVKPFAFSSCVARGVATPVIQTPRAFADFTGGESSRTVSAFQVM